MQRSISERILADVYSHEKVSMVVKDHSQSIEDDWWKYLAKDQFDQSSHRMYANARIEIDDVDQMTMKSTMIVSVVEHDDDDDEVFEEFVHQVESDVGYYNVVDLVSIAFDFSRAHEVSYKLYPIGHEQYQYWNRWYWKRSSLESQSKWMYDGFEWDMFVVYSKTSVSKIYAS